MWVRATADLSLPHGCSSLGAEKPSLAVLRQPSHKCNLKKGRDKDLLAAKGLLWALPADWNCSPMTHGPPGPTPQP